MRGKERTHNATRFKINYPDEEFTGLVVTLPIRFCIGHKRGLLKLCLIDPDKSLSNSPS